MPESTPRSGSDPSSWNRTIIYHAARDALGAKTDVILSRLGYQLVLPETFSELRTREPDLLPNLLLVDERRLDELGDLDEAIGGERLPIVLLTGRQGATGEDARIVGAVKRPAGLHDLYRLMQQVFEDKPRSTPRVPTHLRALCESNGIRWEGRVLSLSENGCLIRSPEAILLGQRFQLELMFPRSESIALEAEATYQLLPDTGLVFSAVEPAHREALERFVTDAILA